MDTKNNFQLKLDRFTNIRNIDRKEKILILPHNTLRVVDTFVQVELEKMKDPKWFETVEEVLFRVLTRKEKDLGKFNDMDSKLVKDLIDTEWSRYYEIAPRTYIYELLDVLHYPMHFFCEIVPRYQ